MTEPESSQEQPWAKREPGAPVDRAFLEDLFQRWQAAEDLREARLKEKLDWLPFRWWVTWVFITLVAWGGWWLIGVSMP